MHIRRRVRLITRTVNQFVYKRSDIITKNIITCLNLLHATLRYCYWKKFLSSAPQQNSVLKQMHILNSFPNSVRCELCCN
ncbi:uncharacterized protein LOC119640701 isoform X2 [Glossina fuscipes]|uniref:Uncharacterized protein LOC119640701 isoform X2 n=1 Tax=Glossina fuscipes TaxID=7396 RepID=A0A9C5ZE35_9MUSC|nr:uncharacterized protein LOC119640701 isoform X2 [Glossina fuscipes]